MPRQNKSRTSSFLKSPRREFIGTVLRASGCTCTNDDRAWYLFEHCPRHPSHLLPNTRIPLIKRILLPTALTIQRHVLLCNYTSLPSCSVPKCLRSTTQWSKVCSTLLSMVNCWVLALCWIDCWVWAEFCAVHCWVGSTEPNEAKCTENLLSRGIHTLLILQLPAWVYNTLML